VVAGLFGVQHENPVVVAHWLGFGACGTEHAMQQRAFPAPGIPASTTIEFRGYLSSVSRCPRRSCDPRGATTCPDVPGCERSVLVIGTPISLARPDRPVTRPGPGACCDVLCDDVLGLNGARSVGMIVWRCHTSAAVARTR
jgi:hypothetical protein